MKDKIRFSWDLHWKCNYRCPYCWWHGKWNEFSKRNVYPGVEKLIQVWKRIYYLYGECHIEIAGGEPSIYPGFEDFILELLNYHTVQIMTNLSGSFDKLINDKTDKVTKKFKMGATFHPLFAKLDDFLLKAKKIKEAGLSIGILYLSYPPQIKDIPKLKKLFADNDIYYSTSTFWGIYKGKKYPDSYTDVEKKIIGIAIGQRENEKFQTEPLITKGKLCNAGHTYALIHPDGEVLPCGGATREGKQVILGNIFDTNFKLLDKPEPCPSNDCACNEWAFLIVKN